MAEGQDGRSGPRNQKHRYRHELSLPPVKIHCSVLAEDAIKAAIGDYAQAEQAGTRRSNGGLIRRA